LNVETIIPSLQKLKLNVYEILVAYLSKKSIAIQSLRLYFNAVKSYFEFNDIDIVPNKFRKRVKMPKYYPEPGEPLTISDIREMLNQCRNERLACYLLLLTSTWANKLHSFRCTAFSIITEQTNSEFANWYIGHNYSVYWSRKEQERRNIYATKCMSSLTILDYTSLTHFFP
jgi:hypothetical protein